MNRSLHVIFGAGQVGYTLAQLLLAEDRRVRVVKRSAGGIPTGAELMQGDAADAAFCRMACADSQAVYHCMNPAYSTALWQETLPRYMNNLIAAAGTAGARLVVLDNLYMLGRTHGQPITENTPADPCSKKGEIRARVAERMLEAHRQGEAQVVCGRAADFYGPRGKLTMFGDYFWKPALAGKAATFPANPDTPHTYHYIPDVAAGLAALGTADPSALGQIWMLPCQPAVTTREMVLRFNPYLDQPIRINTLPRWLLNGLGWVMPMMRELGEMAYQWDEPFIVDDSRFRSHFSLRPSEVKTATEATLAWAREAYAA